MPATFESRDGRRSQGVFDTADEARALKKADRAFAADLRATLGAGYRLVEFRLRSTSTVIPDLDARPTMKHPSFDVHVHSRRQLNDLMKSTNSVPYEPSKKQKEHDAYAQDRMKHASRHR